MTCECGHSKEGHSRYGCITCCVCDSTKSHCECMDMHPNAVCLCSHYREKKG